MQQPAYDWGSGCSSTGSAPSTSTLRLRSRAGIAVPSPGWRSTCSASPYKGPGGCRRGILAFSSPEALEADAPAAEQAHGSGTDLVFDVRDLEVASQVRTGPIRPVRGVSSRYDAARRLGSGSPLGQVP